MIRLSDIAFSYGEKKVLKGLSLDIQEGEVFGFLGPNGCGKTTLFKILSTYFQPASGKITCDELDITKKPKIFREKIGVVFQSPSLDPQLTIVENFSHQGKIYGLSREKLKKKTEAFMKTFDLTDHREKLVRELSGGLKQRLALVNSAATIRDAISPIEYCTIPDFSILRCTIPDYSIFALYYTGLFRF